MHSARRLSTILAVLGAGSFPACVASDDANPASGDDKNGVGGSVEATGGAFSTGGMSETGGSAAGGMTGEEASGGAMVEPSTGGSSGGNDDARSAGCDTERTLEDGRVHLESGADDRSYILSVPENYNENHAYKLVLAFHWLGGNANDVAGGATTEGPYYGLQALADDSTIFIAPEGIDQGWSNPGGRDVDFTDAILNQVKADLCIDTRRVFATGFSFGGAMSYALACARPHDFRAVAVYSAALLSGCDGGTEPVAYFAIRGVQEPVINPTTTGRALRDNFAQVNGCTPQTPPEPPEGSGVHICTSYEGCQEGRPVRWCAFDGGHVASPRDQGAGSSWVPEEAWSFLEQF
jgi:poly(3-hydroxybutyrate) depolymerase